MIEREHHITIGRRLMRQLAVEHPDEVLMSVKGRELAGAELTAYLDGLPPEKVYVSDCPRQLVNGTCGCL